MEPTFQKPDFQAIADYPVQCRARFMELTRPNHRAQMHKIDQCLDDWLLWESIYGGLE